MTLVHQKSLMTKERLYSGTKQVLGDRQTHPTLKRECDNVLPAQGYQTAQGHDT
jgi:hypothetical protein